ncbi:MAG: heavy metal translocating P-type ATPase [Gemmatimonadales bacterium]
MTACGELGCGCISHQTTLSIAQLDCPTEEGLIRAKLHSLPGILALDFDLVGRSLTLTHVPEALPRSISAIQSLGFEPVIRSDGAAAAADRSNLPWWPLVLSGAAALLAEGIHWVNGGFHWSMALLAGAAIVSSGIPTYRKGWIALANRTLNINALMAIAVTGAILIGQWPEAAMVMVLFAVAERLEAGALDRSRRAIRDLLALAPAKAVIRTASGGWEEVDARTVQLGTLVRARPGGRIALDGVVRSGASTVDQAPITGESVPIDVAAGDQLFAGTMNGAGLLEYEVTAAAADTALARVLRSVESAQRSRAPIQRFVDRFARVYTPAVLALAVLVALVPPLLGAGSAGDWIYRGLVLLVIACPCALVISTPVAIVSGLSAAARRGILIKGGRFLELGAQLRWLALDKTGTLTSGKLRVADTVPLADTDPDSAVLRAASLAALSGHPASAAIVAHARVDSSHLLDVADYTALPGRGVSGTIAGRRYHLGSARWLAELGILSDEAARQPGHTWLADQDGVSVGFVIADTVKPSSRDAIDQLRSLGIETVVLSGDHQEKTDAVARQVGITTAKGTLLPDDKLTEIEDLLSRGGTVGMVGDGINDAPALARADIGFAMGAAGTDTAIETAGVALADDDLRKIPTFVRIARATRRVLYQNIALALGIKLVFLVATAAGVGTMWMAVVADVGASLLVIGNSLRLLRR